MKTTTTKFEITLGNSIPANVKVISRTGVRAIIWSGQSLLMMKSNRGDYKFPGGGVEAGESDKQALARELIEETGYTDFVIRELTGQAVQAHPDRIQKGAWYHLRSPYYNVHLNSWEQQPVKLTEKEIREGFHRVWITPEAAIEANKAIPIDPFKNFYIERENSVLQELVRWKQGGKTP